MHAEAYAWVELHAPADAEAVLDIGGRDINGTVRPLFPHASTYRVLDIADDTNVDIVADAATWIPDRRYDVVVCAEVFEHTPAWPDICATTYAALKPGGWFIATMAGPGRAPHSAVDGGATLRRTEHYRNIDPDDLKGVLVAQGFSDLTVDYQRQPADVRAIARRPDALSCELSNAGPPVAASDHGGANQPNDRLPDQPVSRCAPSQQRDPAGSRWSGGATTS